MPSNIASLRLSVIAVSTCAALSVLGCKHENTSAAPAASTPQALPHSPAGAQQTATQAPAASDAADQIETTAGPLQIVPLNHAALRLDVGSQHIYVDPYQLEATPDLPPANLVLITHAHADHDDPKSLAKVSGAGTVVLAPAAVASGLKAATVIENGAHREVNGIGVDAVPMYNLKRGPRPGALFHEKGVGNGYILTIGGRRIYIAGDTECTDEMKALEDIDLAFVPMNLPYTMPPEEAAECVKAFRPKVVYPYHYRGSDPGVFRDALASTPGVEVRVRNWYPKGG